MGCSKFGVVSICQKWSKEGTAMNQQQDRWRPKPSVSSGERRLAFVAQSNRRATLVQIAEKLNAGSDRTVSTSTFPVSQSSRASVRCAGQTSPIHGLALQRTGFKGSAANFLVPDTTPVRLRALMAQCCFGSKIFGRWSYC